MTALFIESQVNTGEDFLILLAFFQFIVGLVQLFGAIIRTIAALITRQNLKRMLIYWGIVIFYFSVLYLLIFLNWNALFWLPFAWGIAIWYCIYIVFAKQTVMLKTNNSITQ
ncbi:MAG: hypothetical protein C0448_13555 [Sphingobacteriaceae bacterium]|nr:hypothetical protein [Sphingobacteriaceae bacterium]